MYFYGASGHAKVVIEAWVESGGSVSGIFDDNEQVKSLLGITVTNGFDVSAIRDHRLILSIGSNAVRQTLAHRHQLAYGNVVHPFTSISPTVRIGKGTVVLAGGIVTSDTVVGEHVIINTGASVDHDCKLGDFVHVAPQATICGHVNVGEGTLIGAGSTVVQNISIGKWATIGAGSVVVEDVPDFAVIMGVPGKIRGYNR